MPTLFNRVYAYTRINKARMLTLEQRSELGKKMKVEFEKSGIQKSFIMVTAPDYDLKGAQVRYYPVEFKERMDKLILNYYRKLARQNVDK